MSKPLKVPKIFEVFCGDSTQEINEREIKRALQIARDRAREFKHAQRQTSDEVAHS